MLDRDPKLDMDMFLSQSWQMDNNTTESNNNDTPTEQSTPDQQVSDTDILHFLRDNVESGHSTGSSGYGTGNYFTTMDDSELDTSKMDEILKDVSDQLTEEQTHNITNLSPSSLHCDGSELIDSSSVIRLDGKDAPEEPSNPQIVITCSDGRDYIKMEELRYLNVHSSPDPHINWK